MTITLHNIDQEEAWSTFTPLELGWQLVTIVEVKQETSSNDNPAIQMRFEDSAGRSLGDQLVVLPQTYGKVLQLLEAAGIPPQGGDWEFNPGLLSQKRIEVRVKEEPGREDPNRTFRVVDGYRSAQAGSGSGVPADTTGLGQGSVHAADDDIPF